MTPLVYKSQEGRHFVESSYQRILADFSVLPFEELFLPTEIARTHVLKFGEASKPPLVMLHGSASNSAVWLGAAAEFVGAYCVYCADIPGEPGLSEPVRCRLESDDPVRWLSSLLDGLHIGKTAFLTISLGSWYALNFTLRHPERVDALSMMTTAGIVPAKRSFIFKAMFYMMLGEFGQKILAKKIYHKVEMPREALEFQRIVSKWFLPVREVLPLFSDTELAGIDIPVQFFGGDRDALIDSRKTGIRLKKLLPHAEIHILKDTGHAIVGQGSAIKAFLTSHARFS